MPLIGGITVRERPEKYPGQPRYKRLDFVREPNADYESWPVLRSSFQIPTILVQETAEVPRIEEAAARRPEVEYLQPLQIQQQQPLYDPYYQQAEHQHCYAQPHVQPRYYQANFQPQYHNPPPPPPPPPAPHHHQHYQQYLDYHHPRGALEYPAYQPGIDHYLGHPNDPEDGLVVAHPYYVEAKPRSHPVQVQLGASRKKHKSRSSSGHRRYTPISYETEYESDDSCADLRIVNRRRLRIKG